jgi:hypothetical protein
MHIEEIEVVASSDEREGKRFNSETGCVSDLYLSCLGALEAADVRKVSIEVSSSPQASDRNPVVVLTVAMVQATFPLPEYWDLNEEARKRMILDLIDRQMRALAKERGWDIRRIEQARDCAMERGLRNVQRWPKAIWSPDRSLRAQVEYEFGPRSIEGLLIIEDRQGDEVERLPLFRLPPSTVLLHESLGKLAWTSSSTVQLKSRPPSQKARVVRLSPASTD